MLLFGEDTWVLNPCMERALSSFQHMVAQRLTGRKTRRRRYRSWEYPSLEEEMAEAGFEEIRTDVTRRQNTVAQYIAARPILDLCERFDWRPGEWVSHQWWEQDSLYLEGVKKRAAKELDGEETISEEEGMPPETTMVRE